MGIGSRPPEATLRVVRIGSRLNSWKEIAAYLNTSVRTVQRWELIEGLPVHRHAHASVCTIYTDTAEVDTWLETRGRRLRAPKCVIVLPFRLLRPDAEIEYLAFGLADAVAASLAELDTMSVRSSLMAVRYAGETDLKRIAREAAADLVMTGTLLRDGCQLRVRAQLVEAASGKVLCSQTAQGCLGEGFQFQDQVITRMVEAVARACAGKGSTLGVQARR